MINAHDAMNTAMGGAKAAVETATGVATKAATGTKGVALDAAMGAMHLLKLARGIDADDVLGLIGLMRRRSNPLSSLFLLGGGLAVGAGIGLLLAPVSGREARAYLLRNLGMMGGKVTDEVETLQGRASEAVGQVQQRAGAVVEQVQEKAGEIAGQVQEKAAAIAGQDQGGEASGDQDQEGGEGEGRKGGRRARSNTTTHLS